MTTVEMADMVPVEDFAELAPGMPVAIDCFFCKLLHHGVIGERADKDSDGPAYQFVGVSPCNPKGDALVSERRTVKQRRVYRWRA